MISEVKLDGDELIAKRLLRATRERVWAAFTDPLRLAEFWGGNHARIAPGSVVVDLRVDGEFSMETIGEDGCSYPLKFRYVAVEPPSRLVFDEATSGLITEIKLAEVSTGTEVVIHQKKLPTDLRTSQAREGLGGLLEALAGLVEEQAERRYKGDGK